MLFSQPLSLAAIKMDQIAPILKGIAALCWPGVALTALLLFRSEISHVLQRLTKAEILGQRVELSEEVLELDAAAAAVVQETEKLPPEQRRATTPAEEENLDATINSIIQQAASDPKLALMSLSAELEKQARRALATRGLLNARATVSLRQALSELIQYGFPENLAGSLQLFQDVRNRIVHGAAASNQDALSALDSGITLLRALTALPNETNIVHGLVPIYSDPDCQRQILDARGLILETTSPGGAIKTFRIFPTTRTHFVKGKRVAWEWNRNRQWREAWYRNPENGEVRQAWSSSMEFVGRSLDDI